MVLNELPEIKKLVKGLNKMIKTYNEYMSDERIAVLIGNEPEIDRCENGKEQVAKDVITQLSKFCEIRDKMREEYKL